MLQRALRSFLVLSLCILGGALTWALSWLLQYICSITITSQSLRITSPPANRLALATVVTVAIIMASTLLALIMDGCLLLILFISLWSGIISGAGWAATHVLPGTTVSTTTAQVLYAVVVLLWGLMLWYIFLKDITFKALDLDV